MAAKRKKKLKIFSPIYLTLVLIILYLPILMVTAKEKPADKHRGFIIGTDDYMTKPVDEVEMLYRIQALLRRAKIAADHELTIGGSKLSYDSHTFTDANGEQILPKKEFQLLFPIPDTEITKSKKILVQNPGY